ncbi:MAG: hypothetical protein ABFC56_00125 [Clostridiaceae bacterium]
MEKEQQTILGFCCKYGWPSHEDEVLSYAYDKFSKWISQFTANEKDAVLEMLNEFSYYSRDTITKCLVELSKFLETEYNIKDNALYTFIKKKEGKICSSIDYWVDFRRINKLSQDYFIDDLDEFPEDSWAKVENIVIIDDCCNSGGSLDTYIKCCKKSFQGKKLYYVVVCAMQAVHENLKTIAEENDFEIVLVAKEIKQKAFMLDRVRNTCSSDAFADFSSNLGIPRNLCLGIFDSQSLMAFYNNTPNNTIGVFWLKTLRNEPIFNRRLKTTPFWEMKQDKKTREEANYNAGKARGKYE